MKNVLTTKVLMVVIVITDMKRKGYQENVVILMSAKCSQVSFQWTTKTCSAFYFPGICQQSCHNTVGSYRCSCRNGWKINSDNKTCADINECENHDPRILCPSPANCRNTMGSYKCSCPQGFISSHGGRFCNGENACQMIF